MPMVIYEYPTAQKLNISKCVLALGFFDGVHIAHRDLLSSAREIAQSEGLLFGVFTFQDRGRIKNGSPRLYGDEEKADMFSDLGADFAVFADFSAISGYSPEDFVNTILISDLNCGVCVAGFNFRFGKGAKGNTEMLTRLMEDNLGRAVIREEIKSESGQTLSATLIRDLISDGRIKEANKILSTPYYIKGRVLHGRKVGRTIGFPTLNMEIEEGRIIPRLGVYATAVVIDNKIYKGVSNIGVCPTFEERKVHLETHIINFFGDLYGKEMKIYLIDFIRDEMTFESADRLMEQINIDKNRVIKEIGEITWQELGLK